jgi:hypothetical protein
MRCDTRQKLMRINPAKSHGVTTHARAVRFAVAMTSVAVLGGCAVQKKPAIPWQTAMLVRPILPQTTSSAEEVADVPELALDLSEPPALLPSPRTGPARPRIPTPSSTREAPPEPINTPQIVPELSAGESSALRQETEQNLRVAERNVAVASRRHLNATQSDLASKVKGFISDAREAGRAGDWPRARDLAKKAQVLSEELANSL